MCESAVGGRVWMFGVENKRFAQVWGGASIWSGASAKQLRLCLRSPYHCALDDPPRVPPIQAIQSKDAWWSTDALLAHAMADGQRSVSQREGAVTQQLTQYPSTPHP